MRTIMTARRGIAAVTAGVIATAGVFIVDASQSGARQVPDHSADTDSPIKHVVVLFDENISFDHYFATYPKAANTDGTPFTAAKHTPAVNNLVSAHLLTNNPNLYPPTRLASTQAMTCDQNHGYAAEQKATDGGLMDKFVQFTSVDTCSAPLYGAPGLAMDYYDGNTVTAMWNYAQHYALNDNSYTSTFGPSTPGALNLVSGQTHGVSAVDPVTHAPITDAYTSLSPDGQGVGTVINDPDPAYDDCSDHNHTSTNALASMAGRNVGNLLNDKNITWGWFQGGFAPTTPYAGPGTYAVCGATHTNVAGATVVDYSPHHSPFGYYESTANPHHLPPTSVYTIGHKDQADHNYDLTDFDASIDAGSLPAVSFVKAGEYQDGHAGYSDPLDEQNFLTTQINKIESSQFWKSTAIVIAYDDSDGWYDHLAPVITNASTDAAQDQAICTNAAPTAGIDHDYQDRCGPGTRVPLLVISPYARSNYVDHTATDQASILKFVETNWHIGRIGDGSFDRDAGSLASMFDFRRPRSPQVILGADGSVVSSS